MKPLLLLGAVLGILAPAANAQSAPPDRVVRLAELEIDPARLDAYKAALRTEIDASIRLEPGVITLYAVSLKDHPASIRLFEMYASPQAYADHLKAQHFLDYKRHTEGMVRSLTLLEADPILLGAKSSSPQSAKH